ncbi:MAG TPA: hypothetical protein VIL68_05860 [Propionibacteriaceae bacterium]|jgi:hypothetical protein
MSTQTTTHVSRLPDHRTYHEGVAEGVRRVHSRQHAMRVNATMSAVIAICVMCLGLQLWERVRQ